MKQCYPETLTNTLYDIEANQHEPTFPAIRIVVRKDTPALPEGVSLYTHIASRTATRLDSLWLCFPEKVTADVVELFDSENFFGSKKLWEDGFTSFSVELKKNTSDVLIDEFDWLPSIYDLDPNTQNPADLKILYDKVNKLLTAGRFGACAQLFSRIDPNKSPALILVGLLRLTFPARSKIKSWPDLLTNTRSELISRDYDADKVLAGLSDE